MAPLHPAQFADQMALPGMEEHAHPWAGPLSKGYRLHYGESDRKNHLQAVRSGDRLPDAEMSWANRRHRGGYDAYTPGEVGWIGNDSNVRGMGAALFNSAHHFDFGQDTVPIHSAERTPAGKRFSDRVRPDLKPDIWKHATTGDHYEEGREWGDNRRTSERLPQWNLPENLHPYQQQAAERERQAAAKAVRPKPAKGQGKLF